MAGGNEPDDDALPVKLPAKAEPSKFGPLAIDYTINQKLQDLIPKEANQIVFSARIVAEDGKDKVLTGLVATRVDAGKFDIGGALAGALDLDNRKNWRVETVVVVAWK
jgi:hypothetical protein